MGPWMPRNPLAKAARELRQLDRLTAQQHEIDGALHATIVGIKGDVACWVTTLVLETREDGPC